MSLLNTRRLDDLSSEEASRARRDFENSPDVIKNQEKLNRVSHAFVDYIDDPSNKVDFRLRREIAYRSEYHYTGLNDQQISTMNIFKAYAFDVLRILHGQFPDFTIEEDDLVLNNASIMLAEKINGKVLGATLSRDHEVFKKKMIDWLDKFKE